MQEYPHHYHASAQAPATGEIRVSSPGLEDLTTLAPPEFGGPGDLWSPETLLVAAVADCFILTFRAIARGSRFDWNAVTCDVEGVLDRVERVTRFTDFHMQVELRVPAGADTTKAERIARRSEEVCLITRSLTGQFHLQVNVIVED